MTAARAPKGRTWPWKARGSIVFTTQMCASFSALPDKGKFLLAFLRSIVFPLSSSGPQHLKRIASAARIMSMPMGWMDSSAAFVELTSDSKKSSMESIGLVLKVRLPSDTALDCLSPNLRVRIAVSGNSRSVKGPPSHTPPK